VAAQDPPSSFATTYSQLLSLAVHELRTPASVVGGYLRMLQRDSETPLGDRHRKMVADAEKSCARIVTLIGELSEIAKLEDPQTQLPQESLDLFALAREVAAETDEAADRGVQLKIRGAESGATMNGDVVRLHRGLGALFRAVLREQPDQATVVAECRLTREGTGTTAIVAIAKDEEMEGALAAPPAAFDEKRGGLGMALPIARRVIERHGGRLWSPPSRKQGFGSKSAVVIAIPVA
jgi:signal transduction histidine kinase